ncbi:MAG: hypothetical protein ACJ71K_09060 [Nitrososphaeraceae archaeon]
MGQQERPAEDSTTNPDAEILEQGDIYFFYRPKKGAEEVKGVGDVRRFFMVTAPEKRSAVEKNNSNKSELYRLFVIGKKSLPEVRKTEARASERYWAKVGGIFKDANELTKELLSDEFRRGDAARPVGEGKYAIVKHHQNHTELAYILEMPKQPGEAQKELGIEKEASYIVTVINPKKPVASSVVDGGAYPSTEEIPMYPEELLKEFSDNDTFVPLSRDTRFLEYRNAQLILTAAREGRDVIKRDIGIEIVEEDETQQSADIFNKLKVRKDQVPIRPLTEGKLE